MNQLSTIDKRHRVLTLGDFVMTPLGKRGQIKKFIDGRISLKYVAPHFGEVILQAELVQKCTV